MQSVPMVKNLYQKLFLFYRLFLSPKKVWKRPFPCDVLIYDAMNSEIFLPYLNHLGVEILSIRGEALNMWALFFAAFKPLFWRGKIVQAYVSSFFELTRPNLVLTFIDNNPEFYLMSYRHKVTTAFIQNGLRAPGAFCLPAKPNNLHVDHMFVFGSAIASKYREHINGHIYTIGSFKNNMVPVKKSRQNNVVLFISQFRIKHLYSSGYFPLKDGACLSRYILQKAEASILKSLSRWAFVNDKYLSICGLSMDNSEIEENFYNDILGPNNFKFIPRKNLLDSYAHIDDAEFVAFIDSTLGYEALSRGHKIAAFSFRGIYSKTSFNFGKYTNFGWPACLPEKGPFWTDEASEQEVFRIMSYLQNVNDRDWDETRDKYAKDIMQFDPGNKQFVDFIDNFFSTTS